MKWDGWIGKWKQLACGAGLAWLGFAPGATADTIWLDSLDLRSMRQGWGTAQTNHSVTGKPMSIAGQKFERGVGTHARGSYELELDGRTTQFTAKVGLDDDVTGPGSITFEVLGDGKKLFDSGVMKSNTPARTAQVDLTGVKRVVLKVTDAGDGGEFDHADWAEAKFEVLGQRPVPFVPEPERPYFLTPKPGPAPHINGPAIYGAHPGNPFLYRIPVQGERPMKFSARDLPRGLVLDASTGIITGTTPGRGAYQIEFQASNARGRDRRKFNLVSGDTLSLTPSMGWNHWYAHYDRITDPMMRQAAEVMVSSGMADVGYQYVNIDDCWMNAEKNRDAARNGPFRDGAGNLLPNHHFPDMKGLADYIHQKGLKAGLYTSPGPKTCAGFAGAYQHEAQDAKQFADWGYDFLKYDWCSYNNIASRPPTLEELKRPYLLMGQLLKQQKRDILYNLCQYGMGEVWKWGSEVGAQSWRTAGDLGLELDRIFEVALQNSAHGTGQGPGAWNDPDYVQIGYVGPAHEGGLPRPSILSPSEQYAFMSLWCLMASPLFYSGDMSSLDEFTLNVLCNREVIEVDQDPLGKCGRVVKLDAERFLLIKPLADGSLAVGLGNRGESEARVAATVAQLGVSGPQRVRDLWRQQELGSFDRTLSMTVPRHGVALVRLWPAER